MTSTGALGISASQLGLIVLGAAQDSGTPVGGPPPTGSASAALPSGSAAAAVPAGSATAASPQGSASAATPTGSAAALKPN